MKAGRAASAVFCVLFAGCAALEGMVSPTTDVDDLVKMHREAQAAFDSGEHARAEALYKGLARVAPNDPEVWLRLGNLYARTDNPEQAVEAYLRSLVLNGADPRAWYNLSVVRLRQAWASLLRAHGQSTPKDPIYVMSAEMIQSLEKVPHLTGAQPPQPAAAPSQTGGQR